MARPNGSIVNLVVEMLLTCASAVDSPECCLPRFHEWLCRIWPITEAHDHEGAAYVSGCRASGDDDDIHSRSSSARFLRMPAMYLSTSIKLSAIPENAGSRSKYFVMFSTGELRKSRNQCWSMSESRNLLDYRVGTCQLASVVLRIILQEIILGSCRLLALPDHLISSKVKYSGRQKPLLITPGARQQWQRPGIIF